MIAGKKRAGIFVCLILWGSILMTSCAAPLIPLSISTVVGGAQLALKGGDLYKQMRKADERKAFELTFEQTWENTLIALRDLSLEISKAAKNEDGDGGLIEAKGLHVNIHIAVIRVSETVSEVGIWAKRDQALAELIMSRIENESGLAPYLEGRTFIRPPDQGERFCLHGAENDLKTIAGRVCSCAGGCRLRPDLF